MTDKEKLLKIRKLADAMYYAAQHLTTDASRLHKAMDEYHQFIINEYHKKEHTIPDIVDEHFYEMLGEEPVSEEFKEVFEEYAKKRLRDPELCMEYIYFELINAIKYGVNLQKEQMIAKAIDGDVTFDYYGNDNKTYGCIAHDSFCLEDFGLKDRDKVKVIVIKED